MSDDKKIEQRGPQRPEGYEQRGVVNEVIAPLVTTAATVYAAYKGGQSNKPPKDK